MTGRGRIKIKISFTLLDLEGVSSHVHNIFAPAEEQRNVLNLMFHLHLSDPEGQLSHHCVKVFYGWKQQATRENGSSHVIHIL